MATTVNVQPSTFQLNAFSGTEKESWDQFSKQLDSCIAYAKIQDGETKHFLHLHLKGGALSYFDQLDQTKDFAALKA